MDIKRFVLPYYNGATEDFYITRIDDPADTLSPHIHEYYQAFYVISGTMVHHVGEGTAELSAGDVFILPPNLPHYIDAECGKVDFYALSFMPSFFHGIQESNKLVADFLHYLSTAAPETIHQKLTLSNEDIIFAEALFKRIQTEFRSGKTGKDAMIKACVTVLLSLFARIYFEEQADSLHPAVNRQAVLYCIEYIKNHYDENISLSEISRRSAMSKTCFCKLFRAITGTSFKHFVNVCRINKAAELLKEGEKISAVSALCGYDDFSTFYRNFVKIMDTSPAQYQKINLQAKSDLRSS